MIMMWSFNMFLLFCILDSLPNINVYAVRLLWCMFMSFDVPVQIWICSNVYLIVNTSVMTFVYCNSTISCKKKICRGTKLNLAQHLLCSTVRHHLATHTVKYMQVPIT